MPSFLRAPSSSQLMYWTRPWKSPRRSSMMRLLGRTSLRNGRSFTFPNCLVSSRSCSSSSRSGLLDLRLVFLSGLPPRHHYPPRLLSLALAKGRGKNFEGSSPPSQLQVGGLLSRHWRAWQSCRADKQTVVVLWDGYRVLFHHLPPVSLEPWELPSCSFGSVRVQALREVSKMLLKEALELVGQLGLGFYSQLFLVEKVTGGWLPIIDHLTLNGFITLTKFQMEIMASVSGSIRKGDWMFSIDVKDAYCTSTFLSVRNPVRIYGFASRDGSTSSVPYVSFCPRPHRCSPESSFWFRSGLIGSSVVCMAFLLFFRRSS